MSEITDEDRRRVDLLRTVSKHGLKVLNLNDLVELKMLVEKKDYAHDKKAQKSKSKLLAKINAAIYDIEEKK
jgi:hypothetical protein